MPASVPRGFRLSGVHCGIKADQGVPDLSIIRSDRDTVAAGVYTQNRVVAAPVVLCRARTPSRRVRGVVINSGNANACTGPQGDRDALQMARATAERLGVDEEQVLVLSTGLIGKPLPMPLIEGGIADAAERAAADAESLQAAARGMMTTDTVAKLCGRHVRIEGRDIAVTGLAKGAAMIGPHMATMLAVVLTDAALQPGDAQELLAAAVDESFNMMSVDGHMSTNDTVLLLASGAASDGVLSGDGVVAFRGALADVCGELARAIVDDGEGATHRITVDVAGCSSRADARTIARTIANSPLVKTAIAGADPNWGHIVSAAGYAGVPFRVEGVSLELNGVRLFHQGTPVDFDVDHLTRSLQENRETRVAIRFSDGDGEARFWTTDLTEEYVRLNAMYHT